MPHQLHQSGSFLGIWWNSATCMESHSQQHTTRWCLKHYNPV